MGGEKLIYKVMFKVKYSRHIMFNVLVLVLLGVSLFFVFFGPDKSNQGAVIELPDRYNQPLVVKSFNKVISITPVKAREVKRIEKDNNKFQYIDVYNNTDVEQIYFESRVKESLVLKGPQHPMKFEYKLDLSGLEWEEQADGSMVFYTAVSAMNKNMRAKELRKIFTIPAPYMIEGNDYNNMQALNGVKEKGRVDMELSESGILTLVPDKEWIESHNYPIIVDPTIEINILNVHSHPQQGEDWVVEFTTQGKQDLKIIPADQATIDDDEFKALYCGDEKKETQILEGDVVFYPDWSCDEVAKVVHYTKKAGKHHLIFKFGDERADAYNSAGPNFEMGEVEISDSLSWTTVNLSNSYNSPPVIIATPVTANNCPGTCSGNDAGHGGMYPIPLVKNVSASSFKISMCIDGGSSSCDTGVGAETFHYFVFDIDDTENYDWLEVGTTTVATNGSNTSETYTTSFSNTPHVWTQAQTYSQSGEIGAVAWVNDNNSTSGFTYIGCVHTGTGNSCDSDNPSETFGYVAIDTTNEAFPSSIKFESDMADISGSAWTAANFTETYDNPRVMVTQNDDDGGQDPEYAWAKDVGSSGMDFRYCEEDAGDVCNTHTSEKTYWFVMEEVELVIDSVSDTPDPVNAGSALIFSVDWDDAEEANELVKAKICKTDALANQNCDGGYFASSTAFSSADPVRLEYKTTGEDAGSSFNYYVFVCDDGGECSSSSSGSFDVETVKTKVRGYFPIHGGVRFK